MDIPEAKRMVAEKIKSRLEELKINRQTFAKMMDVQPSVVTKWLKGHNFTVLTLFDIEWVLKIQIIKCN